MRKMTKLEQKLQITHFDVIRATLLAASYPYYHAHWYDGTIFVFQFSRWYVIFTFKSYGITIQMKFLR